MAHRLLLTISEVHNFGGSEVSLHRVLVKPIRRIVMVGKHFQEVVPCRESMINILAEPARMKCGKHTLVSLRSVEEEKLENVLLYATALYASV